MSTASDKAKVTIVTPVYNGERFLPQTLAALCAQTYLPLHRIVVDDGSTDTTPLILEDYAGLVEVIRQDNAGEAQAVNRGIRAAGTDYICVVNADDLIDADWIEQAMTVLTDHPELVGVYPDYRIIDAQGETLRVVRTHDYDYRMMLEQHLCMIGPGAVFRQSAFGVEAVRSPALPLNGDFDAWLRLGLRGPLRRVAEVKASWREHGGATSLTMRNARLAAARIELVRGFFARDDLPVEIRVLEPQALSAAYYCAATLALHDPAVPGRRYAWRSLCCKQRWPQHILPERRRSLKLMLYLLGLPWTLPLKSVYRRWLAWRGCGAQLDWH